MFLLECKPAVVLGTSGGVERAAVSLGGLRGALCCPAWLNCVPKITLLPFVSIADPAKRAGSLGFCSLLVI